MNCSNIPPKRVPKAEISQGKCTKSIWEDQEVRILTKIPVPYPRWTSPEFNGEDRISRRYFLVCVNWAASWLALTMARIPLHLELLLGSLFLRTIKLWYLGLQMGRNAHNLCLLLDSQVPLPNWISLKISNGPGKNSVPAWGACWHSSPYTPTILGNAMQTHTMDFPLASAFVSLYCHPKPPSKLPICRDDPFQVSSTADSGSPRTETLSQRLYVC